MESVRGALSQRELLSRKKKVHKSECARVLHCECDDSGERGEDDTAFEKQTALFAMAAADVLLVNMWCNDIGREAGAALSSPFVSTLFYYPFFSPFF